MYENASVPCTTAHLFLPIVKRKRRNSCSQENGGLVSMYNEKRKCERTLYDRPSVPPYCEKKKTRRARPSSLRRVEKERARRGETSSLRHVEKEGTSPHCVALKTPALTIRLPVHAIQAALPDSTPPRPVPKTAIPLKLLFIFPTDRNSPSTGTDYFWQGGIKNLDREMEAYEILCSNQEGADMAEGVPTAGRSMST